MLALGYSEDQVIAAFERSYGEFIRLEPKAEGFNWMVWLMPIVAFAVGALLIFLRLRPQRPADPRPYRRRRIRNRHERLDSRVDRRRGGSRRRSLVRSAGQSGGNRGQRAGSRRRSAPGSAGRAAPGGRGSRRPAGLRRPAVGPGRVPLRSRHLPRRRRPGLLGHPGLAKPKDEMTAGGAPMAGMAPMAPMAPRARDADAPGAAAPADADAAHEESAELTPGSRGRSCEQFRAQVQAAPQDLTARRQLDRRPAQRQPADGGLRAGAESCRRSRRTIRTASSSKAWSAWRWASGRSPCSSWTACWRSIPIMSSPRWRKGRRRPPSGRPRRRSPRWKKGLAAAGGSFPPIEELLAQARGGRRRVAAGAEAAHRRHRRDEARRAAGAEAAAPIACTSSSRRGPSARAARTAAGRPSSSPCAARLRDRRRRSSGSRIRPSRSS